MKFPYGICDFHKILTRGYVYVDRTDRIPLIEAAGEHLLFLRPRRFGKSLLLSMLENYYDAAKAGEFNRLFGKLAIGKNPTPNHNRYVVMNWDFSAVSPQGSSQQIRHSLHDHINGCIEILAARYKNLLDYTITIDPENALRSFQSVLAAVESSPYKLCLLIDEYDNFANEVMMENRADKRRYESLLYGEGALKTVFKAVKSAARGFGLDRVFITGVSPVVLSDITSGYNIADNISMEPEFNSLCGFVEPEIEETVRLLVEACRLPPENIGEILGMMRQFYDGFRFTHHSASSEGAIYNPTLTFYFLKYYQKYCDYPRDLLDANLAPDKGKIAYVSRLPHGRGIVLKSLNEGTVNISRLADRFGVEEMLTAEKDETYMVSLLYYFGVLTLADRRTELGNLVFQIPNLVIRRLYVDRIREMLLPGAGERDDANQVAENFYQNGDPGPVCEFVEKRYFKVFDNRDYRWANELTLKTVFLVLLFHDIFYVMDSEPALGRGYADLAMIVRPDMRQYKLLDFLFEFEFVGLGKNRLKGDQVRRMTSKELKSLPAVNQEMTRAKNRLRTYRDELTKAHAGMPKLRVFAVVSVGFERIVWEELE